MVGVTTDERATIGYTKPELLLVISRAPCGALVPTPTCAVAKPEIKIIKVRIEIYIFIFLSLYFSPK
jgi:hypothetical protein